MQELIDHAKEVTKTVIGGAAVAGTTHVAFDISSWTQYASFAAGVATTIYFIVATVIAIRNRDKK